MCSFHKDSQKINQLYRKHESQMRQLQSGHYKSFQFNRCPQHHLFKQYICLKKSCKSYNTLICLDCQNNCSHSLFKLNKIVPSLSEWLKKQNQKVQQQNKNLLKQWQIVTVNIKYCIDILNQLLRIIQNHTQHKLYSPRNLIDITNIVYGMFKHDPNNQSPQMLMKTINNLQYKYHLFQVQNNKNNSSKNKENQKPNWQQIDCKILQKQKKQIINFALSANKKSKQFSQKALQFSQTLAQLIQCKIKQQQTKIKLKQITQKNQISLKDILTYKNSNNSIQVPESLRKIVEQSKDGQFIQCITTFSIQLPTSKKQLSVLTEKDINSSLQKMQRMKKLKQLKINNKNGKMTHENWYHILNYVEMLKFLKDLKLILTQNDLSNLSKLFKQKQKSVRQIQNITISITDEKQLNLNKLNQLLQSLQLRKLTLILSRNNLNKKQIIQFIKKLRIYTNLSQLPLIELNLNLMKNNVHSDQEYQIKDIFNEKCKDVKIKQLLLL